MEVGVGRDREDVIKFEDVQFIVYSFYLYEAISFKCCKEKIMKSWDQFKNNEMEDIAQKHFIFYDFTFTCNIFVRMFVCIYASQRTGKKLFRMVYQRRSYRELLRDGLNRCRKIS